MRIKNNTFHAISRKTYQTISRLTVADCIRKLCLAWMFAITLEYIILPSEWKSISGLAAPSNMSFLRVCLLTIAITAILIFHPAFVKTQKSERIAIGVLWLILGSVSLIYSFTLPYLIFLILSYVFMFMFVRDGWAKKETKLFKKVKAVPKSYYLLIEFFSLVFFLLLSIWGVTRVYTLRSPDFDFGIFSQMFYYMKEYGTPMTTVERDGLLSHFAVHMSPIYYLLLPFYAIYPTPAMLQILQAAVMASAVIPLFKLAKRHGLNPSETFLVCVLLLFYPAFGGGAAFDLHENCFLTSLILWVFYAIDSSYYKTALLFSALCLGVKEDAAIYIAVISLYYIVEASLRVNKNKKEQLKYNLIILFISISYFFIITQYLATSGDGVMTWRYNNLIYEAGGSLFTVIQTAIMCPIKFFYECIDAEKIKYIVLTLVPLLGIPFYTRKYERFILLIPYLLVNLVSDYQYQHNIMFQYNFGSIAMLFYLTIINYADFKQKNKVIAFVSSVGISIFCFIYLIIPPISDSFFSSLERREVYDRTHQLLATIPEDAIVSATCQFIVPLSQRDEIYTIYYAEKEHVAKSDYVVIEQYDSTKYDKYKTEEKSGRDSFIDFITEHGFSLYKKDENTFCEIYKKQ